MKVLKLAFLLMITFSASAFASNASGKYFDRAIFVLFENTNYLDALKQPFFKKLADQGAHFSNMLALAHPSQPNYIALTSGSLNGVKSNNSVDVDANNIVDLLEAKGYSWKVYVEGYPGKCFLGAASGGYARKHNPFISYVNIQKNIQRCSHIVPASEFDSDATQGRLPHYVFYVPDNRNSGHDTGVAFADKWYGQKFNKYLNDPGFMKDTILISTFDESGASSKNQIYTSIFGPMVKSGVYPKQLTLYSLLSLIEDNWTLGSLNKEDVKTATIPDIWL